MKRFTIFVDDNAKRTAIVDNATNVIALLSAKESDSFSSVWELMRNLSKEDFSAFYDDKMEELCKHFMGRAA